MSSKEQLAGIEQINDAVTQLDQQTQQNAAVASQTHDVAVVTDEIAKLIVDNANTKEFIGKNEVKAKDLIKKISSQSSARKPIQIAKKVEIKELKEPKVVSQKQTSDDSEWESF